MHFISSSQITDSYKEDDLFVLLNFAILSKLTLITGDAKKLINATSSYGLSIIFKVFITSLTS